MPSRLQEAVLAARAGMAASVQANGSWLDDPGVGLEEQIDLAFREMKASGQVAAQAASAWALTARMSRAGGRPNIRP